MMLSVAKKKNGLKIECLNQSLAVRLDGAGYWCTYGKGNKFYRRCIDGAVVCGRGSPAILPFDQGDDVTSDVLSLLASMDSLSREGNRTVAFAGIDTSSLIGDAVRLNLEDYRQKAMSAHLAYPEPVPILPPDRYGDIVIQPAIGCPNGKCTFCAFYQGKRFRVLRLDELSRHVAQVKSVLSPNWGGREGAFLGSANAMALSTRRLLSVLECVRAEVGFLRRGIAAFGDADYAPPRHAGEWSALAAHGLSQVVVGLETGDGDLRCRLGKSGELMATKQMVAELKEAGVRVGITVLAGVGDCLHINRTLSFVQSLHLTRRDFVYISPLEGSSKLRSANPIDQYAILLSSIKKVTDARITPYQMERFFYYA